MLKKKNHKNKLIFQIKKLKNNLFIITIPQKYHQNLIFKHWL